MSEMKELYIAPEVELLCFEPMENIAVFLTGLGEGQTPGEGSQGSIWDDNTDQETTGPGSTNPDGDWWL